MKPVKEEKQEKLTIDQRIKNLKAQQEQAKKLFIKCSGAIEILEELNKES